MTNEKRLIDANDLPVSKEYCVDEAGFGATFYVVHKAAIDKAPTVDAVEVVRCKDCKYRYTMSSGHSFCREHFPMGKYDDDFCSYGERKDIVWKTANANWERITNFNGIPIDGEERNDNG